jgi:hypothetical protein
MDISIYNNGVCHCSVCVPAGMEREVVETEVNAAHPTGISSSWSISKDETFAGGQPNPCPCDDDPQRMHYLMEC